VLYIATEGAAGIIAERLPAYYAQRGLEPKEIEYVEDHLKVLTRGPNLLNPEEVHIFCEHIERTWRKPDIVIFDVGTKSIGGADVNTPSVGNAIIEGGEIIGARWDATVPILTHPAKSDKHKPQNATAVGSGQQENLAYFVLRVVEGKEPRYVGLYVAFMKDGPDGFEIPLQRLFGEEGEGPPVIVDAFAASAAGDLDTVFEVLRRYRSLRALAAQKHLAGWNQTRVTRALQALVADGRATKGDKRNDPYVIAPAPADGSFIQEIALAG
jgi:hypothetical protein